MKQIKKGVAISFWVILFLFLVYRSSDNLMQFEQKKAIKTTHQKIQEITQKLHQHKQEETNSYINDLGNNKRDREIYHKIRSAYSHIEKLYAINQLNLTNLKSSLTDSASTNIHSKSKYPKNTKYEFLKDTYKTNLYQNAYNLLNQEYGFIGNICNFGFNKSIVLNASDTTLGFYTYNVSKYVEVPNTEIKILNQKYKVNIEGRLQFDKNFTEPIIFQVNIHTKTGNIEKRYQITPKENQKLQPFDYQEIK